MLGRSILTRNQLLSVAMGYWLGVDPGGEGKFGISKLWPDGKFETSSCSSVEEALAFVDLAPLGVGIDCPMWWSAGRSGVRQADKWIRAEYRLPSRNVQSVNSMWGAVLVQGILFAMLLRSRYPSVLITESHPKALAVALSIRSDLSIIEMFGLTGQWRSEDERDAVIAAICAREGFSGRWSIDLASVRGQSELDPKCMWFGSVHYWWPNGSVDTESRTLDSQTFD